MSGITRKPVQQCIFLPFRGRNLSISLIKKHSERFWAGGAKYVVFWWVANGKYVKTTDGNSENLKFLGLSKEQDHNVFCMQGWWGFPTKHLASTYLRWWSIPTVLLAEKELRWRNTPTEFLINKHVRWQNTPTELVVCGGRALEILPPNSW